MTHIRGSLGAALLACAVLVAGLMACQNDLSDEDIDEIADRIAQNPAPLHEETVNSLVDALLSHPRYLEYLEDDEGQAEAMVEALLANPKYVEYLEADEGLAESLVDAFMANTQYQEYLETTPEEDCASVILMAAVISGDYTIPPDSDVDSLCAWYLGQTQ